MHVQGGFQAFSKRIIALSNYLRDSRGRDQLAAESEAVSLAATGAPICWLQQQQLKFPADSSTSILHIAQSGVAAESGNICGPDLRRCNTLVIIWQLLKHTSELHGMPQLHAVLLHAPCPSSRSAVSFGHSFFLAVGALAREALTL